jgi:hypothetical protein
MIRTIAFGLLACALAGAGCASRPAPLTPRGTATVKLDAKQKRSTFTVRNQHLLVVTLPPTEPTHHWTITYHDTRFLKLMSDVQPPPQPTEGANASFLALNPGRTRLRFVLLPSTNHRTVDPIDQQELILIIQ